MSTRMRPGFYVMIGFHTSLFKAIFTGSAFSNVFGAGTAGSPAPSGGGTSQ
jgi:hypothetical protein